MAEIVLHKRKAQQPRRSTEHPTSWELGGLTFKEFGKRLWTNMDADHDDTFGHAAQLAFWSFFALFPALLFIVTMFGIFVGNHPQFQDTLFGYFSNVLPPAAWQLVQKTIEQTATHAGGWKLAIGILGALWSASSGISSLMQVMNFSYQVHERRPYWKTRGVIAISLTVGLTVLLLGAVGIILFGGFVAQWGASIGLGPVATWSWRILQYPVALAFVVLSFAVLYFYGPNVENKKWYWITPGSLTGVGLWVIASLGFRLYLHFFNSYSATYGSLATVIILLLWFYITALAVLIGAEINAEIESAAAEHGRADAKLKGEHEAPAA